MHYEKNELKNMLSGFIQSYAQRDTDMAFPDWLADRLHQELPEMEPEASKQIVDDIIGAVASYDQTLHDLNQAIETGQSKEEWLSEQLEKVYDGMPIDATGDSLLRMEAELVSSNMQLIGETDETVTEGLLSLVKSEPVEWDEFSVNAEINSSFTEKLCDILGVNYSKNEAGQIDLGEISKRNEHLKCLKRYTADDAILAALDRVAFTQEELKYLLNKGITDVYLCGEEFTIPEGFEEIPYKCINDPAIRFAKVDRLEKAAEQGDPKAQLELYQFKAIKLDDVAAQVRLGDRYYKGEDIEQDYEEAVTWFRKAAEQGLAEAQMKLGQCYYNGDGIPQDYKEAVKWYMLAAEQEDADAQNDLGSCYYYGKGVLKNYDEAVKWYKKAAKQGHAEGQFQLGECCREGIGTGQDHNEAVRWYRKAAEQGYAPAQNALGVCYNTGLGVEQDCEAAIKWYKKAEEAYLLGQNERDRHTPERWAN